MNRDNKKRPGARKLKESRRVSETQDLFFKILIGCGNFETCCGRCDEMAERMRSRTRVLLEDEADEHSVN